ncbi:MAG: FtsX-like permease family protein [Bacteroides sp.]|nr:FtsX-like permease family protein [Bacteroides sp.]
MRLALYIAKRYVFSKKKHNAINIISGISSCGVALATMALVCTMSVFNGFQESMESLFTAFDPQLKITSKEGKVFTSDKTKQIKQLDIVDVYTETLEENVMLQYKDRQQVVTLKGVEDNFSELTSIHSSLIGNGSFMLSSGENHYAIMGFGVMSALGTGVEHIHPLRVYTPKRDVKINIANPINSFSSDYLYSPGVIFKIDHFQYDYNFVLTSISFVRNLLRYENEVSSVELKLKDGVDTEKAKKEIKAILGDEFNVLNRHEQQIDMLKIIEIEKLMSYIFLSFILLVSCFNIIGSLSMMIIDKTDDIQTLRNMGASNSLIKKIFLLEGVLISLIGATIGMILGLLLCYLQIRYGLITFGNNSGSFIFDAYPVSIKFTDLVIIAITVIAISFISSWIPVRKISRRLK